MNTDESISSPPLAGQNWPKLTRNRLLWIKMHGQKVNAVARYPRISTVTPFTLLIDFNRVLFRFPSRSALRATAPPGMRSRRAEGWDQDPTIMAAMDQGRR